MALVRLTKGGGGGGELHGADIVASIEDTTFAGKLVYLYKGESTTPTSTKTFPSTPTSGVYSVTFTVQETGTYRIYSKDGSDNEASESKAISSDDIVNKTSYTVELTTGFNYKKWINYGSTDDYPLDVDDYSSLAEVLADEKAVRQLMTVHDSADYFTTALIDDTDLKTTILASDNALKWIGLRDYTYDKLSESKNMLPYPYQNEGATRLGVQVTPNIDGSLTLNGTATETGAVFYIYQNNSAFYNRFVGKTIKLATNVKSNTDKCWLQYWGSVTGIKSTGETGNITFTVGTDGVSNHNLVIMAEKDAVFSNVIVYPMIVAESVTDYAYEPYTKEFIRLWLASDKWEYALKDHVPVMTADNAPYGTVSGTSKFNDTYGYFKAFDGKTNTPWSAKDNVTNATIQYSFVNPTNIKKCSVKLWYDGNTKSSGTFVVKGYNGTTWTQLHTGSLTWQGNSTVQYFNLTNNEYYLTYAINFTSATWTGTSTSGISIAEVQFYGRTLNVSVPTMNTDNYTPYGEATSNAEGNGYAWNAFDNNTSTYCGNGHTSGTDWIAYDFKKTVKLKAFGYRPFYNTSGAQGKNITVVGIAENGSETVLTSSITSPNADGWKYYPISNDGVFKKFKINISGSYHSGGYLATVGVQFYGVDYSQREFEENSNMHYIYDHGVEIESISVNGGTEKQSYQIYGSGNGFYAYTSDKIDFTDYSLMRAVSGDKLTRVWLACGTVIPHDNVYTYEAQSVATEQAPYNCCLSTLLVNGEYYAEFGWYGSEQSMSISEWWLE